MNMDELEPECSEECTCDKRQVWNSAKDEVKRLRKQLDAATLRASLAIECHPNADDMLQELIE